MLNIAPKAHKSFLFPAFFFLADRCFPDMLKSISHCAQISQTNEKNQSHKPLTSQGGEQTTCHGVNTCKTTEVLTYYVFFLKPQRSMAPVLLLIKKLPFPQ